MREKAVIKRAAGNGAGTVRIQVIRQSDGEVLGSIIYNPSSTASCEAMEMELAAIQGRYNLELELD